MFSTSQLEVLRSHVPKMREQGYLYYLAADIRYTNGALPLDGGQNLYIFYSKEPIVYNHNYEFSFTGDCVGYGFNTDSASNYNNGPRMYNEFFINGTADDVLNLIHADYLWYSTNAIPGENASHYGATLVPVDFVYSETRSSSIFTPFNIIVVICLFFTMIMQFIGLHKKIK